MLSATGNKGVRRRDARGIGHAPKNLFGGLVHAHAHAGASVAIESENQILGNPVKGAKMPHVCKAVLVLQ